MKTDVTSALENKLNKKLPINNFQEQKAKPTPKAPGRKKRPDVQKNYGATEVVGARNENVANYALRLPEDFYKALKAYCEKKGGLTVNTLIFNTLKDRYENDEEFKAAYRWANGI